jgi:hypothetical protein
MLDGSMCALMTPADLQNLRSHLDGLEALIRKSHGGWNDEQSLLEFRRLCWASVLIAQDPAFQEQIDQLVQYAKGLYSDRDHHRWDVGPLFGVDVLRRKIRMLLTAARARIERTDPGYGKRWRDLRAA